MCGTYAEIRDCEDAKADSIYALCNYSLSPVYDQGSLPVFYGLAKI
jgi:hypothetical protein